MRETIISHNIPRGGRLALASMLALASLACGKPGPGAELRYIVAPSGLNLRSQPAPTSAAVKLLPYGTEVTVVSEQPETSSWQGLSGHWTKVKASGVEGWAFGAFLAKEKPTVREAAGQWQRCDMMGSGAPIHTFGRDGRYQFSDGAGGGADGTYTEQGETISVSAIVANMMGGKSRSNWSASLSGNRMATTSGASLCRVP